MTSESHRQLPSLRLSPFLLQPTAYSLKPGLSLVELLIAIGILGVTMMLIGAAFPAGVAMSIAVSDETTSQAVFQKALAEIKANLSSSGIAAVAPNPLTVVDYNVLGTTEEEILESRQLTDTSPFSWAALVRPLDDSNTGPMGNLCQVVVVVSRQKIKKDTSGNVLLPDLQSVNCTGSEPDARTLTIGTGSSMVPNGGYIIDETTGTAYIIVSWDEGSKKVMTLSTPPSGATGNFWVVPGPYDGTNYGRKSPAIRVFQAMLYLP